MDQISPLASKCRVASPHDSVLNSECAYTFHSPYTTENGILVNMKTFIGTVEELALTNSPDDDGLFVRIVKKRAEKMDDNSGEIKCREEEEKDLSSKVTKLGVGVEGGFQSEEDKFETISTYSIVFLRKTKEGKSEVVVELPYDSSTKSDFPMQVSLSADSIIHHSGLAVQQDLKAWELDEEPKPVSKYCENLPFVDNGVKISPNPSDWKCQKSGDTENIWLNLSDGYIGGGRRNWDGSGGSNGALDHFVETGEKYPLVVKLGTITADIDTADCYSYAKNENGPVKIPNLAELLEKRGIKVAALQKTAKSTAELEVELNATYAFDAITEAGANLVPLSGPGLQGLQNLGNSCYINSVVQALFSGTVPELSSRYGVPANGNVTAHPLLKVKPEDAHLDVLTQTAKLASALTSGLFAGPTPSSATVTDSMSSTTDPKYRLAPRMFKYAVARDHCDFCTGQQQDAAQFLQFLLEKLDRAEHGASSDRLSNGVDTSSAIPVTSSLFSFKTTSRLVCSADGLIKYTDGAPETTLSLRIPMDVVSRGDTNSTEFSSPEQKRQKSETTDASDSTTEKTDEIPTITFQSCIDSWAASTIIEDYRWPHLNNSVHPATTQARFKNFPRYMIVQIQRYQLGPDWTPIKLEVNIDIPQEIDLSHLKSSGPQDGENLVPEVEEASSEAAPTSTPSQSTIDENAMAQLMDMGFSFNGCKRALTNVGGSNVEAAMNWIFEHNNDPDFNDPLPDTDAPTGTQNASSNGSGVDEGVVMSLVENLGCFTADQVRAALKETGGAADRAADWLFSHMDDLDATIASLTSRNSSTQYSPSSSPSSLEDGKGKYSLVGLISHIGKNTGSGHYVCHLKKDDKWVIFNDEKVALSESPPFQHAYMYLFQRDDSAGSPNPAY